MKPALLLSAALLVVIAASGGCSSANEDPFPPGTQLAVGAPSGASSRLGVVALPGHAGLSVLRFAIDRESFRPGDFVQIREVYASSPRLAVGDTLVVRGIYQLQSAPDAVLALYTTTRGYGGSSPSQPTQRMDVTRGTGEFELSREITAEGEHHISFYPSRGGRSFGGVYIFPR
jgi:hypothetical protein